MTKNNLNATSPESTKTDSCELKAAKSGPIHAFSPAPNLAQIKTNCCGDFGPDISAPGGVSARGICRTNCNLYLPLQDPSLFNLMVEQVGPVVTTHTHTVYTWLTHGACYSQAAKWNLHVTRESAKQKKEPDGKQWIRTRTPSCRFNFHGTQHPALISPEKKRASKRWQDQRPRQRTRLEIKIILISWLEIVRGNQ